MQLTIRGANLTGTPAEIAELLRTLGEQPAPTPRNDPPNELLLVEYARDGGLAHKTRSKYAASVRRFEWTISPKSFLAATVDDVRRHERGLLDQCAHAKTTRLNGRGQSTLVDRVQCARGLFALTPTPPPTCNPTCPQWQPQTDGPHAHLKALAHFYAWLQDRGLVAQNPVSVVLRRHTRSRPPATNGPRKYCPTTAEVRTLIRYADNPRDAALLLVLAKTGRRPGHVLRLEAGDLHADHADFSAVNVRVQRANGNARTKLRGNLISPLDEETFAFLRGSYLPYRMKRWGYSWGEGPLFPGDVAVTRSIRDDAVQAMVLGRAVANAREAGAATATLGEVTPGCFRHWFTTTLYQAGVDEVSIDLLRGDLVRGAKRSYLTVGVQELRDRLRLPALLSHEA